MFEKYYTELLESTGHIEKEVTSEKESEHGQVLFEYFDIFDKDEAEDIEQDI